MAEGRERLSASEWMTECAISRTDSLQSNVILLKWNEREKLTKAKYAHNDNAKREEREIERETNGKKEENNNNSSGEKREKYERRKPMNRNHVLV